MTNRKIFSIFCASLAVIWVTGITQATESESKADRLQETAKKQKEMIEMIPPCPQTPNCVSSLDRDKRHFVEPLHFEGSVEDAKLHLLKALNGLKRTRVVKKEENVIRAETTTAVLRFVDDVTFFFDDQNKVIHMKSASRVGYSDLGANRRRIEKIRSLYDKGE